MNSTSTSTSVENDDSFYRPLCRRCASRRNGRLQIAGGRGVGIGPIHYMLDGRRVVIMVRRQGAPCVECEAETGRFVRPIAINELFAIERTGQLNFIR